MNLNIPTYLETQLRAFPVRLNALLLTARSKHSTPPVPVCGKTYELLLLIGDYILSAPNERRRSLTGHTLGEVYGLSKEDAARVCDFLCTPSHELMALALPDARRLLLVLPMPGLNGGEGVAILPDLDAQSLVRVLHHSFGGRVCLTESALGMASRAVCERDEDTYVYLRRLLSAWRWLTYGESIRIEDRRALSHHMQVTGSMVFSLLGLSAEDMVSSSFPIPYPFCGSYHPARAAWLLLCLCCGLHRCLSKSLSSLTSVPDNERLLPMIELHVGNRTRTPSEWEECGRLAARYGMLFEVKRTRSTMRIALCPLTPDISPAAFYAFRAPNSLLWQLRASLPTNAHMRDR